MSTFLQTYVVRAFAAGACSHLKHYDEYLVYILQISITSSSCFRGRSVITYFSPSCLTHISLYMNVTIQNFRSLLVLPFEARAWSPTSFLLAMHLSVNSDTSRFHFSNISIYIPISRSSGFWCRRVFTHFTPLSHTQNIFHNSKISITASSCFWSWSVITHFSPYSIHKFRYIQSLHATIFDRD